ncbi:DUF4126 domain-containing protein [sulfur-oxidizing endosymbiont of Gigantopelta aegis]|uniref:DUF4126 domain-containing protein n=1 Tax=sulfur-oxidizing endosymbiont of Gigantopelta aegis TaxID=2794934 RepID=UPI0018DE15FC|nr:DUF4126 domain-containing protein [sulfur-oxidizing endosymbiont of Gigantopelta aegis]
MEEYNQLVTVIAMSMGVAWASGINLYATIAMLGIMGATGNIDLPADLQVLSDPMVIGAAGFMYCVEFFADKIPGVDTGWDAIHTFIRVPAGAILAAGAVGDISSAAGITAGILGGGMALTTHSFKAGSRVLINTSPEPVTNWTASIAEDLAVIAGLWAALNHPVGFIVFMIVFILFAIWVLPKLWRGIKAVFRAVGRFFSGKSQQEASQEFSGFSENLSKNDALSKSVLKMGYKEKE